MPNIPPKAQPALEELLLAGPLPRRNAIESMFCRLKYFRGRNLMRVGLQG